mmetsp:Transcript_63497/g.151394  ORF Transcript_63497/g.151394 Transcript_63497/m.151394 type:complete len:469 (-) Transcript_63497:123-1529(-)|eukprot:CAMPEP_0178420392 /NCGR_PEP_ID=MMETSP0689_2-20121128/26106_1 /TAXON_ID=160604 /ORGANISM="Amphidinium massartii, Strain CS-259" /LENGTH=468 /DNA_ID=CAMNT_0020041867 /DNA_START=56 /DNA_END=1462 /DNA_ORIENTATION=-
MGQAAGGCAVVTPCLSTFDGHDVDAENSIAVQPGVRVGSSLEFLDIDAVKENMPERVSQETLDIMHQSVPLVALKADDIVNMLHAQILETHMDLLDYFTVPSRATKQVHDIFWNGQVEKHRPETTPETSLQEYGGHLMHFLSHSGKVETIQPVLDALAARHCSLNVQPHHFLIFHENVMDGIQEVLGAYITMEVRNAWSNSLLYASRVLIDREEAMYREARMRKGGWRGFREFVVVRRQAETPNISTFTLKPLDARSSKFEFRPGQVIGIKSDANRDSMLAPRCYAITSQPGEPFLQISCKKHHGGRFSTFLHEKAKVGSNLMVTPPFGTFGEAEFREGNAGGTIVMLTAGIGLASCISLLQALGNRVVLVAHIDRNQSFHPFRQRLMDSPAVFQVHYTDDSGRPPKNIAAKIAEKVGDKHSWYICGPPGFMADAMASLVEFGIPQDKIHHEVYGPEVLFGWLADITT